MRTPHQMSPRTCRFCNHVNTSNKPTVKRRQTSIMATVGKSSGIARLSQRVGSDPTVS